MGAGKAGSRLEARREPSSPLGWRGSVSVSDFKARSCFSGRVLPQTNQKGRGERAVLGGKCGLPGEKGQVRLAGQGGLTDRSGQRNFPGCRVVGLYGLRRLEGQLLQGRAGGPCGDSCKWPQQVSTLPRPFSLAIPLPEALAVSSGLEQALSTSSWPRDGACITGPMTAPMAPQSLIVGSPSAPPTKGPRAANIPPGAPRAPDDRLGLEGMGWHSVLLAMWPAVHPSVS